MQSAQEAVQAIDEYLANNDVSAGYAKSLILRRAEIIFEGKVPFIINLPGEHPVPGELVAKKLARKVLAGETTIETVKENIQNLVQPAQ